MKILVSNDNNVNERLDKFLSKAVHIDISRNRIQNIIKTGLLKKNGVIFDDLSYKVRKDDEFEIILDDIKESGLEEKNIDLDIIYEDDDIIVINKQAGLTTHPGCGNYNNTLVNALLYHKKNALSGVGGVLRPGIVHRLDKDTSGLMVVAKNDFSHNSLTQQLKTRELKRTYWAFVWGNIKPDSGKIEGLIERSRFNRLKMVMTNGKTARYSRTNYSVIKHFDDIATLVECRLDTGRTHQIRIHFSNKKFPLIGDQTYGGNARKIKGDKNLATDFIEKFPRQALHSKKISFIQPTSGIGLDFEVELPKDMRELEKRLSCLLV
ncbi:MAG: RluA family pseudouridine synthase [Rickettsiales bacterium]|jgi:23S rRNA pseudouridine1911/1915/1917 synthase|nr:RluA family pseudouridine synthase [Rickettsiales bacterium]